MANTIMASSKTLITSSLPSTPKPHNLPQIPTLKVPKLKQPNFQKLLTLTSTTSSVAAAILAMAPPSIAAEIEKAALFDFNLTLPIIMAEFLILMVSLDKIYYSPLGKFMDDRDAEIKEKLSSVKDTTAEVKQMEDQADAIMKAARAEIAAALSKMKKEMTAETEEKLAEGKKKIMVEIEEAMVKLEAQKEETLKALDSQIAALSDDIVRKVIRELFEQFRLKSDKKDTFGNKCRKASRDNYFRQTQLPDARAHLPDAVLGLAAVPDHLHEHRGFTSSPGLGPRQNALARSHRLKGQMP